MSTNQGILLNQLVSSDSVWNPIEAEGRIPFIFEGWFVERKTQFNL
jgi:hypothetical protein